MAATQFGKGTRLSFSMSVVPGRHRYPNSTRDFLYFTSVERQRYQHPGQHPHASVTYCSLAANS
jgi:hypothetical protein